MVKLKPDLVAEINQHIKPNGNAEITGGLLQSVLQSMTDTLLGSYYTFPKAPELSQADVGKLVGNPGNGLATVYQLAPAIPDPQLGRWVIKLTDEDVEDLNDTDSQLVIRTGSDENIEITRTQWWLPASVPGSDIGLVEMERIRDFINASPLLPNLEADIVVDELIIVETASGPTIFFVEDFPDGTFYTDTVSMPPQQAVPAAFPLGKLIGVDAENNLAFISSAKVEEYILESPITINNNLFNTRADIDFTSVDSLVNLLKLIIVPANNGKVNTLDLEALNIDDNFLQLINIHFVGIAISTSDGKVKVINMNEISFILQIIRMLMVRGVVQTGKDSY